MRGFRKRPSAADTLRQFVYGDVSVEEWLAQGAGVPSEPWASFERAQQLVRANQVDAAAAIWRQMAATDGLESRHALQAWHFLRQAGFAPPADRAELMLGVVAEMPVNGAHDLLAAYPDGTAR